jgi:O-antigen/teichoic acid export membrane protein
MNKNVFLRNVAIVVSGAGAAQALMLLASPVFTRLFSESQFAVFASFTALVAIILPLANGKLDTAILLPPKDSEAQRIYATAVKFSYHTFIMLLVLSVALKLFDTLYFEIKIISELNNWLLLLPFTVLIYSLYFCNILFANRQEKYSRISFSKLVIASVTVMITIAVGFFDNSYNGLIIGVFAGYLFGLIYLKSRINLPKSELKISRINRTLIKKYKDFPLYNSTSSCLNALSIHIPFFACLTYFGTINAGLFALTIRVINAPLVFLSASVSQVLIGRVSKSFRNGELVRLLVLKVLLALIGIALVPTFILVYWGETLFSFIFGENWAAAGTFAQILAIGLAFRFVVSTISCTLNAANRSDLLAIWKVTAFAVVSIGVVLAGSYGDIELFMYICLIIDLVLYGFYLVLIFYGLGRPKLF